ncbi:UNVERIFIED_CONTAM: hypothetical protein GTU68_000703, partial [Idotea baltica]|nr:hypothetical protein [Idotea baltica]
ANSLIASLNEAKDLQCLKLEANTLGVEAAEVIGNALAKHPKFERALWNDLFTGRMKTEIPQALKHLFSGIMRAKAKLIELDLSDNALGPIGVEGITEFIKSPSCYSLQVLRLNNNGLGIKGGTMLAKSLIELTENASKAGTPLKLKVLISGRNRLENEGAKIFAKFFSQVKSLEEIAMPQNGIFHPGITALVKSFSLNPNLRSINLNDNTFTPVGAKSLAQELPNMSNLEIINFGDCLFKTAGAISMAKAISSNHMKLKEIYLDSNEIQTAGGIAVIEAIANKPAISHLMLDTNQFGSDGAEILLEMLQKMGKEDIMGSLEENEDPDEDEDDEEGSDDDEDESVEEETEEEEDDDEEEEEEVEDEEECTGVSPMMRAATLQPVQCSASEFMAGPSVGRFLGLADSIPGSLLQEA